MKPTILLAGGGTGGHVYPLIAVADALREQRPDLELVFVGTERGIEARVVPERGYRLELMPVVPIRGGGPWGALRGASTALSLVPRAGALLQALQPAAVLSIGGYAAGPITAAARLRGIPLALIEPNAAIGLANQLVAPLVQRGYTAFAGAERWFRKKTVLRSGVPIRKGFEPRPFDVEAVVGARRRWQVLVLGGSQGAKALNEAVPRALAQASTDVEVVHQCGRGNEASVSALYAELGAGDRARVVPFIEDMPQAIVSAHLVISRSGASAVSEICAVGRPSLLVPYPHAAADHQLWNARSIESEGAGLCIENAEATPERLARELDALGANPRTLARMADRAAAIGRPRAASDIAVDLLDLAGLTPAGAPAGRT
jgi:UDP-N-acetylglucosamine--N-acetylmuramyl-(pentapeptide) pyrophosphoryl-undecaprenol N-acetylglucosamine transferase